MQFLDTIKGVWVIGKLEIPVKENIPMKDMFWFNDKKKEIRKLREEDKLIDPSAIDDDWWEHVCTIGLGKTSKEIIDSGISEPQFRNLMAEVYTFLSIFGTVEEAKLSGYYDQKIQKKD